MNCDKCKMDVSVDSLFCQNCGTKIGIPTSLSADQNEAGLQSAQIVTDNFELRPWRRFLARCLDQYCYGVMLIFLLAFLHVFFFSNWRNRQNSSLYDLLFFGVFFLGWLFIEPVFLSTFGTTVGKFTFNTKIRTKSGNRLSYREALNRTLRLWVQGLGLGIPIVSLVTMGKSYMSLKERHTTNWDEKMSSVVIHGRNKPLRMLLIISIIVGLVFSVSLL